jgi:hypothetical protein
MTDDELDVLRRFVQALQRIGGLDFTVRGNQTLAERRLQCLRATAANWLSNTVLHKPAICELSHQAQAAAKEIVASFESFFAEEIDRAERNRRIVEAVNAENN